MLTNINEKRSARQKGKAFILLSLFALACFKLAPIVRETADYISDVIAYRGQKDPYAILEHDVDDLLLDSEPLYLESLSRDEPSDIRAYEFSQTSTGFHFKKPVFLDDTSNFSLEDKIFHLLPQEVRLRAKKFVRAALILSEKHQVDPLWVLSVMWTESHFRPEVLSPVGASGLMQLMPDTKKHLFDELHRSGMELEVEKLSFRMNDYFTFPIRMSDRKYYLQRLVNIEIGIYYLKSLLNKFNGSHNLATIAYNMGPGWLDKKIKKKIPVGVKNQYLNKVKTAYSILSSKDKNENKSF